MGQTFSVRLKEERSKVGLTQQALAIATGVSTGSQVSYEAGRRTPDLNYLARLEQVKIDALYVMTGRRFEDAIWDRLDWDLHDKILEAIESWLDKQELKISFARKMELLRLFIRNYADKESVDPQFIHETLRLVA